VRPDSFAARAATYAGSVWHAELAERFARWLAFAPELTVVDIGTGTGFAALAVAGGGAGTGARAGAGTGVAGPRVHGVDRSQPMIEAAREQVAREQAAGRGGAVTFAVGDAHRLGLRDRCADAALFVTSLHYMDPDQALAEARRIVRPGGTVAIAALATGALAPSALFRAVLARAGLAVPDRTATTGSLDQLTAGLSAAGLGRIEISRDTMRLADTDLAAAWDLNATMFSGRLAGPSGSTVAALREQWEARVAAARAQDEERFRTITMLMARARRPDR
jgi:SAM-dependent methyltransferase